MSHKIGCKTNGKIRAKINIRIFRDKTGVCGFVAKNHGDPIVCSAVSILTINTVNAIEKLTDARYSFEYKPDGGFMDFRLVEQDNKALLLLEAMAIGFRSLEEEYNNDISIIWEEV